MKKNILLTGSESFVASFLIKKLKKKYNIIGIDFIKKSKNTRFRIDITKDFIKKFNATKIDYIIHLASISRDQDCSKDPIKCFKTNVIGTLNLIKLANIKKIKNFVFASTQWVYDYSSNKEIKNNNSLINIQNIHSEYALSKLVSEINLKQNYKKNKINSTILRFGIIYGPRENNLSALEAIFYNTIKNNKIEIGSKKTGRNFIHIDDICDGVIKSIKKRGYNIINLEGDKFISLNDIIYQSSILLKKKIKIIEKNSKRPNIRIVSNSSAKNIINWRPKYTLNKGLKSLLKFKKLSS
jgi:nucleoside-diphosphate-sugar epimerase